MSLISSFVIIKVVVQPGLNIRFPANMFPNKVAPKVPKNILKNPPFCSFVSFLIVLSNSVQ